MDLLAKSDEEIFAIAKPFWENLVKASNMRDYGGFTRDFSTQMLFGAIDAKGKLPVSVGLDFPVGTNYETKSLKRFSYGLPESVGMNSYKLKKMDSLIIMECKDLDQA